MNEAEMDVPVVGDETTPTPGTPIDENHRGLCHRAHPGMRHGEWERKRRGWPPYRRGEQTDSEGAALTSWPGLNTNSPDQDGSTVGDPLGEGVAQ